MGEIGISRSEFLDEITFWEARRIIRGYRKRDKLKHQLMAECVYAAMYTMRDPQGKTVEDIFPQIFENDDDFTPPMTDDEIAGLQADIEAWNANIPNIQQGETQP